MNSEDRKDRDKKMVMYYEKGTSVKKISQIMNISYVRTLQIFSEIGINVKNIETELENSVLIDFKKSKSKEDLENIFKKYGKSKVYYFLNKNNIKPAKIFIEKRNTSIAIDFKNGISPKELAEKYDVNQGYIYGILGKKGLRTFLKPEKIKERNQKIRDLYSTKEYTQEEIAKKFKLTRGCIGLIVTKAHPYHE